MNFRRTLAGLALAGTLALTTAGCLWSRVYQEGIVTSEVFDRTRYTLDVETKEGEYIIRVREPFCILPSPVNKVELLEKTIKVGDSIKFPIEASYNLGENQMPLFNNERMGSLPADEIEVLKK